MIKVSADFGARAIESVEAQNITCAGGMGRKLSWAPAAFLGPPKNIPVRLKWTGFFNLQEALYENTFFQARRRNSSSLESEPEGYF